MKIELKSHTLCRTNECLCSLFHQVADELHIFMPLTLEMEHMVSSRGQKEETVTLLRKILKNIFHSIVSCTLDQLKKLILPSGNKCGLIEAENSGKIDQRCQYLVLSCNTMIISKYMYL